MSITCSDNTDFTYDEMIEDCDRFYEETAELHTELLHIADTVIARLKSAGITIMRYDAYSTNSIYLKLDYGVLNSIRISDHSGKKHLNYKYNLLSITKDMHSEKDKYLRYYYPLSCYLFMIDKIIFDRNDKVMRYGANNYARYMEERRLAHLNESKGFWSKSELL